MESVANLAELEFSSNYDVMAPSVYLLSNLLRRVERLSSCRIQHGNVARIQSTTLVF